MHRVSAMSQCRLCGTALRCCPSCGTALSIEGTTALPCRRKTATRPPTAGEASRPLPRVGPGDMHCHHREASAADASWMLQLPHRLLSPFEIFCFLALPLDDDGGGGPASSGAATDRRRDMAQAWLHLDAVQRMTYESYAALWSEKLLASTRDSPAAALSHPSRKSAKIAGPKKEAGGAAAAEASFTAAPVVAATSRGREVVPPDANLTALSPKQVDQKNKNGAVAAAAPPHSSATQRVGSPRPKSSYYFFVQHYKGHHKTMRKLSLLWSKMTPQEKISFDIQAANARTAQLMRKE